ncbi:MAG: RNA-binding domain-containing protein [Candidatus Ozemobacteraceae bacterium]
MFDDLMMLVKTAQEDGDFAKFIGLKENLWFEAKGSAAYDFTKLHDILEFAKDVSAFANAEGGILIIGLRTEKQTDEQVDVVTTLDLLELSGVRLNSGQASCETMSTQKFPV